MSLHCGELQLFVLHWINDAGSVLQRLFATDLHVPSTQRAALAKDMREDVPILITGYLGSPVTAATALASAELRRAASLAAVEEMCRLTQPYAIFVALTGSQDEYQRFAHAIEGWNVRLAWFPQNDQDVIRGKGYLEGCLIQAALEYWGTGFGDRLILKLTAKYVVENLSAVKLMLTRSRHDIVAWRLRGGKTVDTRCFAFRKSVITEGMRDYFGRIDDRRGYYMEHAVHDFAAGHRVPLRGVCCRPILSGLSGSSGRAFRTSPMKRMVIRAASLPALAWMRTIG